MSTANMIAWGQPLNKYGLKVISDSRQLKNLIAADADNAMPDVKKLIPALVTDLKYCGNENFMKQPLYPHTNTTYLRKPAAVALAAVQEKLLQKGLGLKIWDAYRPYSVTEKMWEVVKDDRYAADPKFGSGHNRGIAVDLTIINLATGEELNMGTGFDNFSDTAHVDFKNLPEEVMKNRMLLQQLMQDNGFKVLDTEWWHFYLTDAKKYDLLNISFKELRKLNKARVN
jgi:D-alanyl-D-alanine dipeptidase